MTAKDIINKYGSPRLDKVIEYAKMKGNKIGLLYRA